MMKKIYLVLLIIAASTGSSFAQNSDTKKADKFFNRFEYIRAAEAYQKLVDKDKADTYVYSQLANTYYYMNDFKKAEPYYKRVVSESDVASETVYNYVQTLRSNKKYDQAKTWMEKFAKMAPSDSRVVAFNQNPNYASDLMSAEEHYTVKPLKELNSQYSDFGAIEVDNVLYFSSARNTSRRDYGRNEEPFLEIYQAQLVAGEASEAERIPGDVNTKFHEGTMAVSQDGKRIYFDRNDYFDGKYEKNEEGVNQLNIYYAEKVNGEWVDVQSVPFNNSEYSVGHPALSPDGKTLYFVSDMPGSMGESDIYKVSVEGDSFGEPENLGAGVNTEGKEVFPYIGEDGALYFSSNGHPGLGGLDVFYAEAQGNAFGPVNNMGVPINTSSDDFSFFYDKEKEAGYVASDRKGSAGADDIYRVKLIEICEMQIDVLVVDAGTEEPISGARVNLFDSNESVLGTGTTKMEGETSFSGQECNKAYAVQADVDGYESNSENISTAEETPTSVTIRLTPEEELIVEDKIVLDPILFDFDKSEIKPQAALELDKVVDIMERHPNMVVKVEGHTDNRGNDKYNKSLSDRRAKAAVAYIVEQGIDKDRISGEGFGEERPLIDCGGDCTEEEHDKNRRSEFIIVER